VGELFGSQLHFSTLVAYLHVSMFNFNFLAEAKIYNQLFVTAHRLGITESCFNCLSI